MLSLTLPILGSNQSQLTELNKIKAENFNLSVELAQCQASKLNIEIKLANVELSTKKAQLELDFRKELKCEPTDIFNWTTLKCEKLNVKKNTPH